MKKSIFLFFAAILCAMTANAQLYLRGGFNDWNNLTADYQFVSNVCNLELPAGTTYEFKIADSGWGTNFGGNHTFTATATKTLTSGGGNMKITTTIPGTYRFEFVQNTKKLTVTYPELPAPHDITVRAKVPASWTNTITAWVWTSENGSGEEVTPTKDGDYYVVTKNAGALYVVFKNGAGWNGDKNQTVDLCYTEDVCLQLNQSGSAKATATVIDCGAISKDITVKAVVPGAWENTITAWVWPTGGEGKEVTPTKDGNWYVVTENCIELNVIFKNGEGWNGNENQTANIAGVSENTCYQISALNKDGEGKCTYTVVDCGAVIEPEAKPEPTPTYDYYITGTFNGWNEKDPAHGMTLDGEVYKATVTLAAGENLVKVTNGTWTDTKGYGAMGAEYDEVSPGASDDNIQVDLTEGKEVVVVYNATTKKITFEGLTEKAPAPTFDYYITGSFNGNNPKKAENGMTLDGTVYKATVTLAAGDNTLKVTDGTWEKTWGANELGAAYEEVSNPNDYNNIKITLAAEKEITVIFDATGEGKITFEGLTPYVAPLTYTVTVPAGTEKCYIAGNMNGWAFQEMEAVTGETNKFTITIVGAKETDEYKYACQADWAYAEVIEGGGNRTAWQELDQVEEWGKPVVVTYQLKGVGGWEQPGIELVQNPENDKEYMLTCQAISATDAVKVVKLEDGEQVAWYGSVKDGVEVTVTYDDMGNIQLPEGYYNFYFDSSLDDKQLWIAAATDCEEIGDIMELTMTNLVVTPMGDIDVLEASENTYNISVTLGVDADGNLKDGSNVTKDGETNLPINYNLSGKFTKSTDAENGDVYSGLVVVEFDGGLIGLQLTMYASTIEVTKVNLTGGTVTLNEEGAYVMSAKWDTEDVIVELTALELEDWVSILIGDRVVSGNATVTNQGEIVTLEANGLEEWNEEWTQIIAIYDITITATLDLQNVTVYFINTPKWNTPIYAYATKKIGWGRYQEVIAENAPSPGVVATKEDYQIAGYDVYSYTALEGTYNKVQFSGNEVATDEAGWESDMYYIHNFDGNSGWYTKADAETLLTPDPEETPDYTRTVTAGKFGTLCLPFGGTITGAVLYECVGSETGKVYLGSVNTLTAGVPYIFQATATELAVYSDGTTAVTAGNSNGLYGTFTDETPVAAGNYILLNNALRPSNGEAKVNANRAYLVMSEVPVGAPQQMPGRRYIGMSVQGENETTGVEDLFTTDTPVKVIENGQLIIIRDGVKYNVQGQVIR